MQETLLEIFTLDRLDILRYFPDLYPIYHGNTDAE